MRCPSAVLAALLLVATALPAAAQSPTPAPAPDAATLDAAKAVVAKMQGDRAAALTAMSGPMVGLVQQMGVKEPDRAQVLVQEVLVPVMTAHYDDLLAMQARSFATVLSKADLLALGAFYDTPAGRNFAAAQPRLAQAQLTGVTQWMGSIAPEMQTKLAQTMKARGWGPKP